MNTAESESARRDAAARSRIEKIRRLSLTREEPVHERGTRMLRIMIAMACILALQSIALVYFMMIRPSSTRQVVEPVKGAQDKAALDGSMAAPGQASSPEAAAGIQLQAQGFIIAMRQATVSTRVAGIVTAVPVDVGDFVERGQIVGVLNSDLAERELQLSQKQLASLRASVARERARLDQAEGDYRRELLLEQGKYTTQARIAEKKAASSVASSALASALAELEVGEVRVQQQRSLLANYTIRAPFAGIVVERNSQVGELVAPMSAGGSFTRTGICTIVDMDSLVLVVDVGEQQIQSVKVGQAVNFRLYSDERVQMQGRVQRVVPSADRAKGTLQVRITISGKDSRVLPGMRANVNFIHSKTS